MTTVIWFTLISVNWDRFALIKNKHFSASVCIEVLDFSKIVET